MRDFIRSDPGPEDEARFRNSMNVKSDLEAAMLPAIEIDYVLERAISQKFARNDAATIDLLSKDNGPFGTFFSKIVLGYALGLYDAPFMECLHIVRRIRNAFAHGRREVSFATPLLREELASVKLPPTERKEDYEYFSVIKSLTSEQPAEVSKPALALSGRAAYVILTLWLNTRLVDITHTLRMQKLARAAKKAEDT